MQSGQNDLIINSEIPKRIKLTATENTDRPNSTDMGHRDDGLNRLIMPHMQKAIIPEYPARPQMDTGIFRKDEYRLTATVSQLASSLLRRSSRNSGQGEP